MYIYIFLFFFNARVSLNYYFDSPNWLITTFFFFFYFLFCLYHVCYMLYMSVLKTMYYVHVWNKSCSVLFSVLINASNERIYVEFWTNKHLGLPTFKLPTSTKTLLRLTCLILFWKISVYDYKDIGPSSVVYIFHKGTSTVWLWSTDEYVLCFLWAKVLL